VIVSVFASMKLLARLVRRFTGLVSFRASTRLASRLL
jgi:hypothetical protein